MTRPRKVCAECGHHRSVHEYTNNGRALGGCKLCKQCPGWRQPAPYERIKRIDLTKEPHE